MLCIFCAHIFCTLPPTQTQIVGTPVQRNAIQNNPKTNWWCESAPLWHILNRYLTLKAPHDRIYCGSVVLDWITLCRFLWQSLFFVDSNLWCCFSFICLGSLKNRCTWAGTQCHLLYYIFVNVFTGKYFWKGC